jgi:hypothetical protein
VNPFAARFQETTSTRDFAAVIEVEPAPLTEVPPAVWEVIRRALAKRPANRFGTAQELAEALRDAVPGVLAPDPRASAVPVSPTAKRPPKQAGAVAPGMPRRRYRLGLSLVASVVALLAFARPSSSQVAAHLPSARAVVAHHKQLDSEGTEIVLFDSREGGTRSAASPPPPARGSSTEWIERSVWEERARQARRRLALGGSPRLVRDPGF